MKKKKCSKYRNKYLLEIHNELSSVLKISTSLHARRKTSKSLIAIEKISNLLNKKDMEIQSLRENNSMLAKNVQKGRERVSYVLQDKLEIQTAYHEVVKDNALQKKEIDELEKSILMSTQEFNSSLTKMVNFSDSFSSLVTRFNHLKHKIEVKGSNRAYSRSSSFLSNISFGSNANQPVSHVNPMVNGCVIQKPTINVCRLNFSREAKNHVLGFVNQSSPIQEEEAENNPPEQENNNSVPSVLLHNIAQRRCRRRAISPSINRQVAMETSPVNNEESLVDVRMEPVVRLEDVTRLLQNSSMRISENDHSSSSNNEASRSDFVNSVFSPQVLLQKIKTPQKNVPVDSKREEENPLEGCSWMHQNSSNVDTNVEGSPFRTFTIDCNRNGINNSLHVVENNDERSITEIAIQNSKPDLPENQNYSPVPIESSLNNVQITDTNGDILPVNSFTPSRERESREWDGDFSSSTPSNHKSQKARSLSFADHLSTVRLFRSPSVEIEDGKIASQKSPSENTEVRKSSRLSQKNCETMTNEDRSNICTRKKRTFSVLELKSKNEISINNGVSSRSSRVARKKKKSINLSEASIDTSENDNSATSVSNHLVNNTSTSRRPVRNVRTKVCYQEPSLHKCLNDSNGPVIINC